MASDEAVYYLGGYEDQPAEDGAYWIKRDGETQLVNLYTSFSLRFVSRFGTSTLWPLKEMAGYEWYGPIKPPPEVRG